MDQTQMPWYNSTGHEVFEAGPTRGLHYPVFWARNAALIEKRAQMIRVVSFEFNPFQENTWLLYDDTGACVIVDPGCYDAGEQRRLQQFIEQHTLTPVLLLNTHCHLDHIFGNAFVHRQWGLAPHIHRLDLPFLERAPQISMMYGIPMPEPSPQPAGWLEEGQEIRFGDSRLEV
ncbi:MAG: MBL fold metallo-hydrolase, partial [Bacteroidetes bacterium]